MSKTFWNGLVIVVALGIIGTFFVVHKKISQLLVSSPNESLPLSTLVVTPTGDIITVRVAHDAPERELGLSGFNDIPPDEGMLFVFENQGRYPFWMKGMLFPLDIIWLKKTLENTFVVVYVAENVRPETYPDVIDPGTDADAVLEIKSGFARVYNLDVGKNLWIEYQKDL